jgi:hypothetical protein
MNPKSITPSATRCVPILQTPVTFHFALVAGESQNVHAGHLGVHLLERAGFDERMDAFARADGKMMLALRANLEVFVQFLVENHRAAGRAFRPQTFGDVTLLGPGLVGVQLRLDGERRLGVLDRRGCQRRLDLDNAADCLLGK